MKRSFTLFFALTIYSICSLAQQLGDYRSNPTANVAVSLNSIANWQFFNGTSWVAATTAPNAYTRKTSAPFNEITIESGDSWNNSTTVSMGTTPYILNVNGSIGTFTGFVAFNNNANSLVRFTGTGSVNFGNIFAGLTFPNLSFIASTAVFTPSFSSAFTVNNTLTINSSILTFTGSISPVTFNGNIQFSNGGKIYMNATDGVINLGSSTSFSGIGSNSYIQLNTSSFVGRQLAANTPFIFPIGTINNYLPITVNPQRNKSIEVNVFEGATISGLPGGTAITNKPFLVDANWRLRAIPGGGQFDATITLEWQSAIEGGSFSLLGNNLIGISQNRTLGDNTINNWDLAAASSANNSTNFATRALVSIPNNGIIGLGVGLANVVLPLTTRNFTAAPRNGKVQLDWTGVATHISSYFEVERSNKLNGQYSSIAKIPVSGVGEATYRYMDNNPLAVDNFYRIKVVDENQKITYTRALQVRLTGSHLAINNLFPTLVQGSLNLVISNGNKGDAQVEVIDMAGRIALKQYLSLNTGSQTIQLDVSRLTQGSYTVLLRKGDQAVQSRFIKQ